MNVFSALLAEFKGVFGKAYLLAGVLPASLFVTGAVWFRTDQGLVAFAQEVLSAFTGDALGELTAAAVVSVLLGLLFFAGRSFMTGVFESMRGKPLTLVRVWLTTRQVSKRMAASRVEDQRSTDYTILTKWVRELDFQRPKYLPPGMRVPKTHSNASLGSLYARVAFENAQKNTARGRSPSPMQYRRVISGLRGLYAFVEAHGPYGCAPEIAKWRELRRSVAAAATLTSLGNFAHREWMEAKARLDEFPQSDKWMRPTRLGSLAAVLDDYAEERYGIETSALLGRLSAILADSLRAELADSRLSVEVMLNLVLAMFGLVVLVLYESFRSISAAISASRLLELTVDWRGFWFLVLGILFAALFYLGALHAYRGLIEKAKRAVDLNRLDLISALGLVPPSSMDEERELWLQIAKFFRSGTPLSPNPLVAKK